MAAAPSGAAAALDSTTASPGVWTVRVWGVPWAGWRCFTGFHSSQRTEFLGQVEVWGTRLRRGQGSLAVLHGPARPPLSVLPAPLGGVGLVQPQGAFHRVGQAHDHVGELAGVLSAGPYRLSRRLRLLAATSQPDEHLDTVTHDLDEGEQVGRPPLHRARAWHPASAADPVTGMDTGVGAQHAGEHAPVGVAPAVRRVSWPGRISGPLREKPVVGLHLWSPPQGVRGLIDSERRGASRSSVGHRAGHGGHRGVRTRSYDGLFGLRPVLASPTAYAPLPAVAGLEVRCGPGPGLGVRHG
jgi:hypothetical protein